MHLKLFSIVIFSALTFYVTGVVWTSKKYRVKECRSLYEEWRSCSDHFTKKCVKKYLGKVPYTNATMNLDGFSIPGFHFHKKNFLLYYDIFNTVVKYCGLTGTFLADNPENIIKTCKSSVSIPGCKITGRMQWVKRWGENTIEFDLHITKEGFRKMVSSMQHPPGNWKKNAQPNRKKIGK